MKKTFVRSWRSSAQPRKQRKYLFHAPLHLRQSFLGAHLSRELRQKHGKRSFAVRKGDQVKVVRGQFKGKSGTVRDVLLRQGKVLVEGIEVTKADGSRKPSPLHPSNIVITALQMEDLRRKKKLESRKNVEVNENTIENRTGANKQ